MDVPQDVYARIQRLERWFLECPGTITAFSGGVDSSLVAFLARHFLGKEHSLAAISASPSLKISELAEARKFALSHDIRLQVVVSCELEDPHYFTNPANRCYYCKDALYTELEKTRSEFPQWWVINGQNSEDTGDHRSDLYAACEHAVRAPLAECAIDKAMVRTLAAHFKLECWDKPASPCLASRIPFGERVTLQKLRQIEEGEGMLKSHGFPNARVRHYGERARIEVPPERVSELCEMEAALTAEFKGIGFGQIEIDHKGFVADQVNWAILEGTHSTE